MPQYFSSSSLFRPEQCKSTPLRPLEDFDTHNAQLHNELYIASLNQKMSLRSFLLCLYNSETRECSVHVILFQK